MTLNNKRNRIKLTERTIVISFINPVLMQLLVVSWYSSWHCYGWSPQVF